jgi:hypothetical protein
MWYNDWYGRSGPVHSINCLLVEPGPSHCGETATGTGSTRGQFLFIGGGHEHKR